jgi:hypothetical protein
VVPEQPTRKQKLAHKHHTSRAAATGAGRLQKAALKPKREKRRKERRRGSEAGQAHDARARDEDAAVEEDLDELDLDVNAIQTGKRRRVVKHWDATFAAGEEFDDEGAVSDGAAVSSSPQRAPQAHAVAARPAPARAPPRQSVASAARRKGDDSSEDDFGDDFGLREDPTRIGADDVQGGDAHASGCAAAPSSAAARRLAKADEVDEGDLGSDLEDADDWASASDDEGRCASGLPQRKSRRAAAGGRLQAMLDAELADDGGSEEEGADGGDAVDGASTAAAQQRPRKIVLKRPGMVPAHSAPQAAAAAAAPAVGGAREGSAPGTGPSPGRPGRKVRLKMRRVERADVQHDEPARAAPMADGLNATEQLRGAGCLDNGLQRVRGAGTLDASDAAHAGPVHDRQQQQQQQEAATAQSTMVPAGGTHASQGLRREERAALPLLVAALRGVLRGPLRFSVQDIPAEIADPEGLLRALEVRYQVACRLRVGLLRCQAHTAMSCAAQCRGASVASATWS